MATQKRQTRSNDIEVSEGCEVDEIHVVADQDDQVDKKEDIINCVALYYEKGSSGINYLRKEKFRAALPRNAKSVKKVRETVRLVESPSSLIQLTSIVALETPV